MAKFKVYYTIELNEVATHIFESCLLYTSPSPRD